MKDRIDDVLSRWLVAWVGWVEQHHRPTIGLVTLATLLLGLFTATHLGVNMDHKQLLDPDLPFQRATQRFSKYFPNLEDSLLIVVDADTPELARSAADAMADRLRQRPDRFTDVYVPRGGRFLEEHALLYRSVDELDDFTDHLAQIQPVLGELTRDASIANLARLIAMALQQEVERGANAENWAAVLDRVGEATVRVFDEYPVSISWQDLILEGSALDPGSRQVVVAEPVLDFGSLLPAGVAIGEIREIARDLSLAPDRGVRVRITGNPALNQEEMIGLAWDVGVSSLFSFAFVTVVLFLAFRSLRLVSAAALTLLTGLIWTAAVAAVAVGHLNLLSIAFGVLFIGLGVDFAIHMGMSYADFVAAGKSSNAALRAAAGQVGSSLVLCMVTTAIGFFVFVPTDYKGVAELGLISGAGMIVILFQTMTFFPAVVTGLVGQDALRRVRSARRVRLSPPATFARHPGAVVVGSLILGIGATALLPQLRFDSNVVNMRDDRTESVQTFKELLRSSDTSPWYIDVLTPSLAEAQERARRLRELDVVEATLTLADFVPENQEEKIEVLADAALLLDTPSASPAEPVEVSPQAQIAALRALHTQLDADWLANAEAPLAGSARRLRDELKRFLDRIEAKDDPGAALDDLGRILLGHFPDQLDRLRRALEPSPITLENLPDEIASRMVAADGHARIQVFPRDDLSNTGTLTRYVDGVRSLEPDATGVAPNILEFGRATTRSLRQALLSAILAITLLVWFLWRRWIDTALVMSPVLLAAALTAGTMVLLGIRFDFVNVVVLPLLLGIGVDSGIHLVHRAGEATADNLLETTTARAVFFSALTTVASFGSLAFSGHRGISSMGKLLVSGMLLNLACNLIFLPALIALRKRRAGKSIVHS